MSSGNVPDELRNLILTPAGRPGFSIRGDKAGRGISDGARTGLMSLVVQQLGA
jgi:hypothetical protein